MAKREFAAEGLELIFVSGSNYLGACIRPQKELTAWVKPQVEASAHRFRVLGKIVRQHPRLAYSGLVMSLQLEWQFMQSTVPGFGTLRGPIEETLREIFFPVLFRQEEINTDFR